MRFFFFYTFKIFVNFPHTFNCFFCFSARKLCIVLNFIPIGIVYNIKNYILYQSLATIVIVFQTYLYTMH